MNSHPGSGWSMWPAKTTREYAFTALERADRTEKELRRKLEEKGCPPEEIRDAVAFLKEYHYLDDAAYTESYIRTFAASRSRRHIRLELEKKGVPGELIEEALAETQVDEAAQIRRFLVKKGLEPGTGPDPVTSRRLMAALARRGYPYDMIRSVMDDFYGGL